MRLKDKVTLITGAASGIGRATAGLFAAEGARVVVADLAVDPAAKVVEEIRSAGGDATAVAVDVSQSDSVAEMIAATDAAYGRLDVLCNNAGISHAQDDDAEATSLEVWNQTLAVNLTGVFLGCKHGLPLLRRSGGGVVINTASFVAVLGAATPQLAYTASKGGVLAMTRELAVIHARENIRVVALCPGPLRTELLMKYLDTEEKRQRRLVHIPMGRFGEAEEIARAALFPGLR